MKESHVPLVLGQMERMCSVSSGRSLSTRAMFHSFVSLDRRSATIKSWSCGRIGPVGTRSFDGQIHESIQTFVVSSLPITLPMCLMRRSLPRRIPFQPCDEVTGLVALRNEILWQYFPRRVLASRHSGLVMILHPILAKRAWLKACMSLKPNPPNCLVPQVAQSRS